MTRRRSIDEWWDLERQHWPESAARTRPPIPALYRVHEQLFELYRETLKPFGIQPGDCEVLSALRMHGPPYQLTPTELYRSLLFSSGGLTKVLKRLEQLTLVERARNPEDRRSALVRLSVKGKATVEAAMDKVLDAEHSYMSALDDRQQEQLGHLLAFLLKGSSPPRG